MLQNEIVLIMWVLLNFCVKKLWQCMCSKHKDCIYFFHDYFNHQHSHFLNRQNWKATAKNKFSLPNKTPYFISNCFHYVKSTSQNTLLYSTCVYFVIHNYISILQIQNESWQYDTMLLFPHGWFFSYIGQVLKIC